MNLAKVSNYFGEQLLYGRLVKWSRKSEQGVKLVAEDGATVTVNRALLEFFSPMLSHIDDGFDTVFTPISAEVLTIIGDILDLGKNDSDSLSEKHIELIKDDVTSLGIAKKSLENLMRIKNNNICLLSDDATRDDVDESNDIINDFHTEIVNGINNEINVLEEDGSHKPIQINVKKEISLTDDLDEDVNQVEVDQLGSGLKMSANILEDFSFDDEEQQNFINDKYVVKLEANDEINDICLNFDPDKEFSELRF